MRIGYSEFSFGYAFTENLIRWSSRAPTSAPHFPNLVDEGSRGYDVRIDRGGCPLFLQYKVPEKLTTGNAVEIRKFGLPGICTPFFRMSLMQRDSSAQHRLLVDLESLWPGAVFYTAPCMWDEGAFNEAYVSVEVHRRSVLFSPQEIGYLPDSDQHSVAYRPGLNYAWFRSTAREIGAFGIERISEERRGSMDNSRYRELRTVVMEIRQSISSISPWELRGVEERARERVRARRMMREDALVNKEAEEVAEELEVSRDLARVGLGVELLIVQPRS